MDSSSNQILDNLAVKKQLSLFLVGSGDSYQSYKRTQQIKGSYPNDLHYYNDTFYYRNERNIEQIKKIKQMMGNGIIKPGMLIYNSWNTFYPSYIMNHHFSIYLPILELFNRSKQVATVYQRAKKLQQIGFFAKNIINTDFGKTSEGFVPNLNKNNEIQMKQNLYFYDKHISLYYHVGCFLAQKQGSLVLTFIKIRDQNGDLVKQVLVRDFGERISSQYLQIGYNFNKVKPFLVIKILNDLKIGGINNTSYFSEFNLSLLDLKKALFLAIRYTKMRVQFKTLPESGKQRPILTYQSVSNRIIKGYARLVCFSQLNRAFYNNRQIIPVGAPLMDISHHLILESVIRLRQCCGGFGYLQVAGFGGCIERLTLRASDCYIAQVPANSEILKRLHYYSSSDDMESFFGDKITKQKAFNPASIFSVFINICVNMRKSSSKMRKQVYLRHFMYQAGIQILNASEQFSRIPKDSLPFLVLFYELADYILQNVEFVNWIFIEPHLSKEEYFRGVTQFRRVYLDKLVSQLPQIQQILEVDHIRNVIMGRQNSSQFYDEVLKTSKDNLRNSEEFINYIKAPIVEFLVQNNSRL